MRQEKNKNQNENIRLSVSNGFVILFAALFGICGLAGGIAVLCCAILHELAHLKVKNHGPEFVAVLDQHMPQWQERKKLLNESKLDYMDSNFEK